MSAATSVMSQPKEHGMIVEKDVKIPLRDGGYLYADIFRPDTTTEKFPAIANITVYNKVNIFRVKQTKI